MVTTDRNSKKLYSLVNEKRCDKSGISSLKAKANGLTNSELTTKATILNQQFSGVFTREDTSYIPSLGNSPHPNMHSVSIGVEGVRKLLFDLDTHEATSPDNIPTRFLKDYTEELAPALSLLFSASVDQGQVPTDRRHANVTPIFKKGDHSDPANYRPILLTQYAVRLSSTSFTDRLWPTLKNTRYCRTNSTASKRGGLLRASLSSRYAT
ncbi:uncharacterized protein LOC128553531 [Mercenaria mercenaria]|uniref:uncharacterized protein LOC128553531 n=1 Tax=Mercenaria mercenaria TaxID=6596 RepID=UPI00234F1E86|nr:uncharacterized protein LOC128553531 [Mercenaria mercenaria]